MAVLGSGPTLIPDPQIALVGGTVSTLVGGYSFGAGIRRGRDFANGHWKKEHIGIVDIPRYWIELASFNFDSIAQGGGGARIDESFELTCTADCFDM